VKRNVAAQPTEVTRVPRNDDEVTFEAEPHDAGVVDVEEAAVARASRVVAAVVADRWQSGRNVLVEEEPHARWS